MDTDTPYDWLEDAARRHPDEPALILSGGIVSYSALCDQVHVRSRSLAREVSQASIVPVPMRLDLPSIVEMLALMKQRAVMVPYESHRPEIAASPPAGTAVCIATSGSSGSSKLVPISYGNIAASVEASRMRLSTGASDRWLATLPLTHVGGLSVIWRTLESGGAAIVAPFNDEIEGVLAWSRPTVASLVPTMVHRLLGRSGDSLAAIGLVLTGGAHLGDGMAARALRAGVKLVPTYGMTETTSQVATAIPGAVEQDFRVVGPPLDGFEVAIRDRSRLVRPGTVGVIEVAGPAVTCGYLGEPARSGVFITSDLGFLTDDGKLAVVGRIDDVIVSGGENVSLVAVRDAIIAIQGVTDVAVVGVPDPEWGSIVCAFVQGSDVPVEEELREIVTGMLSRWSCPRYWAFGTIPLLGNGKHDLAAIQRMFVGE